MPLFTTLAVHLSNEFLAAGDLPSTPRPVIPVARAACKPLCAGPWAARDVGRDWREPSALVGCLGGIVEKFCRQYGFLHL